MAKKEVRTDLWGAKEALNKSGMRGIIRTFFLIPVLLIFSCIMPSIEHNNPL